MIKSILFCVLLLSPVPETECERTATLIEQYNNQVCELYAKILVQEGVVSDLADDFRDAVRLRQINARAAQVLLDILAVRPLTPDEAKLLTEFLTEGIVLDRAVRAAEDALNAAKEYLDTLKSRLDTMTRLLREKREWYAANCTPSPPSPNPEPDPNFP